MTKKEVFKQIKEQFNSEDLDTDVHEIKSSEAATINNSGIDAQLEYLCKTAGLEWLIEAYLE